MISDTEARALRLVRDHEISVPKQFAWLMWPDSEGWKRAAKCGHGSHRGGGMYLAAGGYLGKLQRRKLINWMRKSMHGSDRTYYLTNQGKESLEEWESAQQKVEIGIVCSVNNIPR